MVNISWNIR